METPESNILPTITLYQPWATWIMRGLKTIETRIHYRFACLNKQTILIHAGLTTDKSALAAENPYLTLNQILHNPDEIVNGFILGSVYVNDFAPLNITNSKRSLIDCSLTSPLRYGLFLENIKRFPDPIPIKGQMGIWYFDLDKMQKVKKPTAQTTIF